MEDLNFKNSDLVAMVGFDRKSFTEKIIESAFKAFESQLEQCAERALGCSFLQGLKAGRVTVNDGQPFVDGKQIAFVSPPKLLDGKIVWTMRDLSQEKQP